MIGNGVLKGLAVTLREFLSTYPPGRWLLKRLRLPQGSGIFTIQYPEELQKHAESFRCFPFLLFDGSPEDLRCVACRICEQECPPQCIKIVMAKDEQNRPMKAFGRTFPDVFDIDISICMSCRICVDVCPFDAIKMDNQFALSCDGRFDNLVIKKEVLLKSAKYFAQINPGEASASDKRISEKAAKIAKPQHEGQSGPPPSQARKPFFYPDA